jgi:fibronectin-binding autotransporter adhesin
MRRYLPALLSLAVLCPALLSGPREAAGAPVLEASDLLLIPPSEASIQIGNMYADGGVSALVIANGAGPATDLSGTLQPTFQYVPSSNASTYDGGSTYTGVAGVRAACLDAYNANWNFQPMTSGGTSGFYAADGYAGGTVGIGYATSTEYGQSTFGGVTLCGTSYVVMREAYFGDANLDGAVDLRDLAAWQRGFLAGGSSATWASGDFTYQGTVTLNDYKLWQAAYYGAPGSHPLCPTGPVTADPYTWTGATSRWSTGSNWSGGSAPWQPGLQVTFGNSGASPTVDLGSSSGVAGELIFNGSVSTTIKTTGYGTLTLDNGSNAAGIVLAGSHSISAPMQLNSNLIVTTSLQSDLLTISGPMADGDYGSSGLIVTGDGTLLLSASNTYSGGTTIYAGTLQLGDGLANNGYVQGDILNQSRAGGLVFATATAQTFSGTISGTGSLIAAGSGKLTLTSTHNSYSGGTSVTGGTLALPAGANVLGTGGILVENANAVLSFANGATLGGNLTVQSGGELAGPGGGSSTLLVAAGKSVTILGGGHLVPSLAAPLSVSTLVAGGVMRLNSGTGLDFNFAAPGTCDLVEASGSGNSLVLGSGGDTLSVTALPGFAAGDYVFLKAVAGATLTDNEPQANWLIDGNSRFTYTVVGPNDHGGIAGEIYLKVSAVPEPGTLALLAAAAGCGLAAARRRRRRGQGRG